MGSRMNAPEFITEFIELYRQLPCLWNINNSQYSNRVEKNKAYERLLNLYKTVDENATVDTVKNKINNLRSSFRKELKKVQRSERSGCKKVYAPSLWYFNSLLFTQCQENSTNSALRTSQSDEEMHESENDEDTKNFSFEENYVENGLLLPTLSYPASLMETCTANTTSTGSSASKREYRESVTGPGTCRSADEDEFDVVGSNVAHKLRRMDAEQRDYAEHLINTVLFNGIRKKLNEYAELVLDASARE